VFGFEYSLVAKAVALAYGFETVERLASSFCGLEILQYLNLAYHAMGTKGALALAEGLQHTPQLLDISTWTATISEMKASALSRASFTRLPNSIIWHL